MERKDLKLEQTYGYNYHDANEVMDSLVAAKDAIIGDLEDRVKNQYDLLVKRQNQIKELENRIKDLEGQLKEKK